MAKVKKYKVTKQQKNNAGKIIKNSSTKTVNTMITILMTVITGDNPNRYKMGKRKVESSFDFKQGNVRRTKHNR